MKKTATGITLLFLCSVLISSVTQPGGRSYLATYKERLQGFRESQVQIILAIRESGSFTTRERDHLRDLIGVSRLKLKGLDFWFRYLDPIAYKKINGPLPVEWEKEVFEKFEAPYRREGAGLTLAELYLDEAQVEKDSLVRLIETSLGATAIFLDDSITRHLNTHHHFFLANRLFLLNLASVYTTGFECPDTARIIPELELLLGSVEELYESFDAFFPSTRVKEEYLSLYQQTVRFVQQQPKEYSRFDHFSFLQQYVNPLFRLNQQMIRAYKVRSSSMVDYALNNNAVSIFDKSLYEGQNQKGVYIGIDSIQELEELKAAGRLLFFDPLLSVNNKRSCASCHDPSTGFTDTSRASSLHLDAVTALPRNSPTLLNTAHHHLLMLDGKHINLENQCMDVITNPAEMGSQAESVVKKVMSCPDYKKVFSKYLRYTPEYEKVQLEHIASAILLYYTSFSNQYAPFDHVMNQQGMPDPAVKRGFNLFMGKSQCATCHFVPQFNGTKPPFISSEFEVIGVPADTGFTSLSPDKGRYAVHPVKEMLAAFRTNSLRNVALTKPYMHNGVFRSLEEVIDFYDAGGGAGKGLPVPAQTLSSDSLKLAAPEKKDLLAFIHSLTEDIPLQKPPARLPVSKIKELNDRKPGGEY